MKPSIRIMLLGAGLGLLLIAAPTGWAVLRPLLGPQATATVLPVPTGIPAPLRGGAPISTGGPAVIRIAPTLSLPQAQATAAAVAPTATAIVELQRHPPTPTVRPIEPPAVFIGQDSRATAVHPGWRGPPPFTVPLAAFIVGDPRDARLGNWIGVTVTQHSYLAHACLPPTMARSPASSPNIGTRLAAFSGLPQV